ncbi:type II toxin-antitoxin system HicB family antitoxin [Laspinema olomoucense]|uniref:type II toxin-antitoxin system HicB family antitoxin n=1 Tax=Laspinema olomoucense TaxID=3231600 RepID=UPI0021BADF2B|nr:type II toxin-antitoxin system HicB family antitoxin [Laspinema sp. D3c]MCT7994039.1 type II toxin-antitoxin system HicB family antitoxin [Laspinema sp. D3c]
MLRYEIIMYWSQEDEAFIAEVPELAGCAADGATYQEALTNVEVVMQEWMETAQALGRPIPETKGKKGFCSFCLRELYQEVEDRIEWIE